MIYPPCQEAVHTYMYIIHEPGILCCYELFEYGAV